MGIAGVAALVGGILVLGAGRRLVMRLSGAMALSTLRRPGDLRSIGPHLWTWRSEAGAGHGRR